MAKDKRKKGQRKDGLIEKKVWVPLPEGTLIDKQSSSIRYNKEKNIYEKRQSFYNKDKRLLEIEVNEVENQIIKGTYVLDNNSTFEQVARKWYRAHALAKEETTRESYEIYMNHAIKLLGDKKIQEIKTSDVKEAYNNFLFKIDENGNKIELHSKNSLKHLHAVVNMVFKFAIEDKILWKNPCDALNKKEMRPEVFEPYVYTEDEFNALLDKVKGTKAEIIALLAGGVGMRAGEICALKKDKINIEKNQITINEARYRTKGKTGEKKTKSKNRTIYVDPHIIKTITQFQNDGVYVISRSTNKPYRNDELYHIFTDALEEHGLPMTRLHDLRHYNATQMALHGIDIKTAAYRLGDTPETILKIYQHVQESMDRSAAEKLGKMFKSKEDKSKEDKSVVNSVVTDKKEKDLITTDIVSNPTLN
jgi:integrase